MHEYESGERVGRYLVLIDVDGRLHALSSNAIQGVSQDDADPGECILALNGGRFLRLPVPFGQALDWLR
ncbi:hypothetical protein E6C67_31035 [Azospirillum sp. TSA2s]|uniref:hypothetical protein n=1 Tax=Azospirillum sp. TSA2s TaxID=709810 RepID=UPI0010AAB53C|nr:hypothetical protein [Azospirillum sp. TSA2s]QCG98127.1 hypothetical protein E6C67_31035 [Azospirillum sp. TSA2s]